MTSSRASKATAIAVYTGLRVLLLVAVWLTLELLTPISGVWAIVAALLISMPLSLVFLDRQRGRMAVVADGFFKGINERIEASARAEDVDDEDIDHEGEAPAESSAAGEQGEQATEGEAVDQDHDAGLLQGGHEGGADRSA